MKDILSPQLNKTVVRTAATHPSEERSQLFSQWSSKVGDSILVTAQCKHLLIFTKAAGVPLQTSDDARMDLDGEEFQEFMFVKMTHRCDGRQLQITNPTLSTCVGQAPSSSISLTCPAWTSVNILRHRQRAVAIQILPLILTPARPYASERRSSSARSLRAS